MSSVCVDAAVVLATVKDKPLRGGLRPSLTATARAGGGKRRSGRQDVLRREEYGTHSLRRTKASIIYKATDNLRAGQILLGHSKIENTVRYLGVDVEDALTPAEATEI